MTMHCSAGVVAPVFLTGSPKRKRTPMSQWNTKWFAGNDKLMHFLAGLAMVSVLYTVGVPLAIILLMAVSVMFGKEFIDSLGYGNPDWWDFTCGLIGIILAIAIVAIVRYYGSQGTGGDFDK